MSQRQLTKQQAWEIYQVLHEECGASGSQYDSFESHQTSEYPPTEWRFQGSLGFGGKFWNYNERFYVNCYQADLTPEREQKIAIANRRLKQLHRIWFGA